MNGQASSFRAHPFPGPVSVIDTHWYDAGRPVFTGLKLYTGSALELPCSDTGANYAASARLRVPSAGSGKHPRLTSYGDLRRLRGCCLFAFCRSPAPYLGRAVLRKRKAPLWRAPSAGLQTFDHLAVGVSVFHRSAPLSCLEYPPRSTVCQVRRVLRMRDCAHDVRK
jgi:hypothetical protein